jgi:hypothetical protein
MSFQVPGRLKCPCGSKLQASVDRDRAYVFCERSLCIEPLDSKTEKRAEERALEYVRRIRAEGETIRATPCADCAVPIGLRAYAKRERGLVCLECDGTLEPGQGCYIYVPMPYAEFPPAK